MATNTVTSNRTENQGYAAHFERRPEFLFGNANVPNVVDASTVRERTVADLKVFHIPSVFSGRDEVFIGFGIPNAYLVVPDGNGGYQKFAGKSLRRAPSVIEDTREWAQSGILLRFKNLPAGAVERLRAAMKVHHGNKYWTCVNANLRVMEDAGFSAGKRKLSSIYMPKAMLAYLLQNELKYEGQTIDLEWIRTTPSSVERHAWQIMKAEAWTFCRHAERKLQPAAKKNKFMARLLAFTSGKISNRDQKIAQRKREVAPALPEDVVYEKDIRIQVARTSMLGTWIRQLGGGTHAFFEGTQDRVKSESFLSETLKPFPQAKPSWSTRLKKAVLFSRPVVAAIRHVLARDFSEIRADDIAFSERDVYDMLRTHSASSANKYNIVLTRRSIILARISVGAKLLDWILSKHVLMSGYAPDVIFAGEMWKDAEGTIWLSANSGTYRPTIEQLEAAAAFLRAVFPHLRVEILREIAP
ncbi:MAG: hypothetical protein JSS83_17095 [Cyanobacteria bacterium SZAS LIN-3]|nr:hypothetical protein [Cyanobacteria bacterium SZAS LIN-3]MBS2011087.1 hypothetical protein [Cyanobacteria bacterium SZAS TMP-1]